jgi:hypothetical protein
VVVSADASGMPYSRVYQGTSKYEVKGWPVEIAPFHQAGSYGLQTLQKRLVVISDIVSFEL